MSQQFYFGFRISDFGFKDFQSAIPACRTGRRNPQSEIEVLTMFVIGNLLSAVAQVLNTVLTLYTWLLIIRVLISWVSPDPYNPIVQFLIRATDPVLIPFRRIIPPLGMFDISAMVAILAIQAVQHFLVRTLFDLSIRMR